MKNTLQALLWVGIFAAAMAFLESAVVVYLRAVYYPEGFVFPLKMMDPGIMVTEIVREAATMVMLITVAVIAGKNAVSRFAIFIYAFAIWDIFYYIYLVLLLGWPSSMMTWDLLFLIPVTWVGPVLAPVINSLTMILLAVLILNYRTKNEVFRVSSFEWFLLILGSLVVIFAYTRPYMQYMLARYSFSELLHFSGNQALTDYAAAFVPLKFNWILFSAGQVLFFWSIGNMVRRMWDKKA
ncbi:MAG: hypothetical protein NTU98_02585 [Bacteroidetes bacterium]|nr:hypothetical protein [Bacteroidota bacterium]